uniref:Uncharacterized protein n=1 Tax=Oryza sativa subsp. japonica TaxID=39947 RepID=Q10RM0_ORYSJ|nr:hypothetical protein LOC_Os03g05890 [Oryza sativa Japonica Group]
MAAGLGPRLAMQQQSTVFVPPPPSQQGSASTGPGMKRRWRHGRWGWWRGRVSRAVAANSRADAGTAVAAAKSGVATVSPSPRGMTMVVAPSKASRGQARGAQEGMAARDPELRIGHDGRLEDELRQQGGNGSLMWSQQQRR